MNAAESAQQMGEWLKERRVGEVECVVADMGGIARGKILPTEKFLSGLRNGTLRLPESVQHGLDAFEGERTCSDSGGRLEGAAQEAWLRPGSVSRCVGSRIGHGLVLRGSVLRRWRSVLRRYLLIARR